MNNAELKMVGRTHWLSNLMISIASWLILHSRKWDVKVVKNEGIGGA